MTELVKCLQVYECLGVREGSGKLNLLQNIALAVQWGVAWRNDGSVDVEAIYPTRQSHYSGYHELSEERHTVRRQAVSLAATFNLFSG